jgi:autotransporter-associated beta strand protein
MHMLRKFAVAAVLAGSLAVSSAQQGGDWTGAGTDQNWSTGANWFAGVPPTSTKKIYFEDFFFAGWTNQIGAVNNVVDSNIQIGALYYTATSSGNNNHYYTTLINPGVTLQVGPWFGSSQPTMAVGDIPGTGFWTGQGATNYTQIRGGGTLFVNDPLSMFYVGASGVAPPNGLGTILDMTNLCTFTADVAHFYLDVNLDNPQSPAPQGFVFLARTNTITTTTDGGAAPGFLLGAANGNPGAANFGTLILGAQSTFNSDAFVVGGSFCNQNVLAFTNFPSGAGQLFGPIAPMFAQNTGVFKLRGSDGLSRAAVFSVGDQSARPGTMSAGPIGSGSANGTVDLRQGSADILADRIYLGHGVQDGGVTNRAGGIGIGGLIYEAGTVDVNNIYLGYKQGTNASLAFGYLTLQGNAVMTVNNNFYMAYTPDQTIKYSSDPLWDAFASNIVSGNAVLNIGGNLQHNDGPAFAQTNGASFLSLRGGLINMFNGGLVNLWSLEGFGTISNASLIAISNAFSPGLFSGNIQSIGTLNLSSNVQFLGSFPINFDIGSVTNIGAPFNDYVSIKGDVSFNSNAVTLLYGPNPPQVGAPYTLMTYTGTKTGSLVFTNTTRSAIGLDQSQPGKILLLVSNWTPGNLTWNGVTNQTWSATGAGNMVNWGQNMNQVFMNFDNVRFDDSVVSVASNPVFANLCFPNGLIFPGAMYFTNNSVFYCSNRIGTAGQEGSLYGTFNITKDGTNTLNWSVGAGTNNFTGNWFINQGAVKVYDSTFAHISGRFRLYMGYSDIYLTNAASLDLTNSSNLGAGNALYIAGTGMPGYSSGTPGTPSMESDGVLYGKSLLVPYFKARLLGDATVSTYFGAIGFTGITNGTGSIGPTGMIPFSRGELSLNSHTLTVHGSTANPFILINVDATTAGDINFLGSPLRVRSSSITGSGTMRFTNNTVIQFNASSGISTIGKNIQATNWAVLCETNFGTFIGTNRFTGTVAVDESVPFLMPGFRGMLVSNDQAIEFDGPISGSTELYKMGRGPLLLNGANTYAGTTWVNSGSLILGPSGTLASPVIALAAGAPPLATTLGLPAGGFTLASGQTLALNGVNPPDVLVNGNLTLASGSVLYGAATINGSLTLGSGSELAPGGTNNLGQIVVSNNLTMNGAHLTWDVTPSFATSDGIVVNGDLNLSGVNTFTIDAIGSFSPDRTNTLITYTGKLTGGLANLALSNPNVRFVLNLVDPATTPGKIQVVLVTAPGNLVWSGADATHPTYWDIKTTTNWINATTNDIFASGDTVTFDQSSSSRIVDVGGTGIGTGPMTPTSMTITNAAYVFQGANGLITSSLLISNAASVVLANYGDNLMVGSGISVAGDSSLSMRQTNNASLFSDLQGSGTFDKSIGTNTLRLVGNASSNWSGTMSVNAGQLSVGQDDAIAGSVSVASGATLDIGGHAIKAATVTAQGVGFDGQGAINDRLFVSTNLINWQSNVLTSLTLAGDTTIGAISNAWGIQSLTGNGFNLTKTNANDIWIATGTETGLGNVTIAQGRLIFEGTGTGLGDPTKTIYTMAGSTLGFATTNYNTVNVGTGPLAYSPGFKNLTFGPNATFLTLKPGAGLAVTNVYLQSISFTNNLSLIAEHNLSITYLGNISSSPTNNGTLILSNTLVSALLEIGLFGTNTYASNTWCDNVWLTVSNQMNLPANSTLILSNANGAPYPNANTDTRLYVAGNSEFTNLNLCLSATNAPVVISGSARLWGNLFMHGSRAFYAGAGHPTKAFFFNASGGDGLDLAFTNIDTSTRVMAPVQFGGNKIRLRASMNLWVTPGVLPSSGTVEFGASLDPDVTPKLQIQLDSTNNWYSLRFDTGRINWNTNNVLPPGGLIAATNFDGLMDLHGFDQTISQIEDQYGFTIFNDSTNSDSTLTIGGSSYTVPPGAPTTVFTNTASVALSASTNTVSHHLLNLAVTGGLTELLNNNNYDGVTTVSGGKLLLGNYANNGGAYAGGLQGTPSVTVSGTGIFGGNGFVGAPVSVNAGGTILPGECLEKLPDYASDAAAVLTRTGPLTFGNTSLTLNSGSTAIFNVDNGIDPNTGRGTNASIVGLSSVQYGGTLVVSNISAVAFTNNQVVKLFDAVPGNYLGAFTTITVSGASGYDASRLTVDGTIKIKTTTPPSTAPVTLARSRPDRNTLTLSWPADHIGWRLQIQTNTTASGLVVGRTNVFLLNTNWVSCDGATAFNSTNLTIGNTNVAFRLVYP